MAKHIVFIHGVGEDLCNIVKKFEKNIEKEIAHMGVDFHPFLWKSLASKKEAEIRKKIGRLPKKELFPSLSLNLKESIETYLISRLRKFLIGYFGDIVFYLSKSSENVKTKLESLFSEIKSKDEKAEITLVAHSLGSVIAFDFLSDKRFQKKIKAKKICIGNLFTVGSPLPLFLMRSDVAISIPLPLSGKWVNIYDKRDLIASPLSTFFDQCSDFHVKVHDTNPLTVHTGYFNDAVVLNEMLRTML